MERCTMRGEFCQAIERIAERFAEELWATVVETVIKFQGVVTELKQIKA